MSGLGEKWVLKGEHDYKIGKREMLAEDPATDMVCFHMQQCVEKYLKAFLSWRGKYFRRTHDIAELIELCKQIDGDFDILYEMQADKLTRYAVEVRYPEEFFVPGVEEAQRCVAIAEQARAWIRKKLGLEEA